MTEEPYRWLEAIQNRREYIRDQLKGGTPVFAVSRPEGVLLLGVGFGQSKVFEIYDRHGYAALGHPVDIEKLRQTAIEAAHLEGFNRSSHDVTLRRLISFSLSPAIKHSFEHIFSPPFIVESLFAEVGSTPESDVLVRVHYDGNHQYSSNGVLIAHTNLKRAEEASLWLKDSLQPDFSLSQTAGSCLTAWQALMEDKSFADLSTPDAPKLAVEGKTLEAALLDRHLPGPVQYRAIHPADWQT
jgi:proteasome alpha subunit